MAGNVVLKPEASVANGDKVDRFELFVDGRRTSVTDGSGELAWDSRTEGDGYHELRVVAIADSPIETQGRQIIPIVVDNVGRSIVVSPARAATARWDQPLTISASSTGASQLLLVHNNRIFARAAGERGELKLNPRILGTGPVKLQAIAVPSSGPRTYTFSAPLEITIGPTASLAPLKDPPARLFDGLALTLADGKVAVIPETRNPTWLATAGVKPNETFSLQGFFDIKAEDIYQFQLWHYGELKLNIDGVALYSESKGDHTQKFVPVALAKGLHRLSISGKSGSDVRLRVLFGGPGALSLTGTMFRHPPR